MAVRKKLVALSVTALALVNVCSGPLDAQAPVRAIDLQQDTSTQSPAGGVPNLPGWILTYDDEFYGTLLDSSIWHVSDYPAQTDLGVQYWSPDDVSVQHGYLSLRYEKRTYKTWQYTSGEVDMSDACPFLYGRVEIRARMPKSIGAWVRDGIYTASESWPPSIDLLQYFGNDPQNLQFGDFWEDADGNRQQTLSHSKNPAFDPTQWHVYALEWRPGSLTWFVDGVQSAVQMDHVPAEPMGLSFSTSIGSYAGDPAAGTWPQSQDIDYVRIYRMAGLPPPVVAGPDQQTSIPEFISAGLPSTFGATVNLNGQTCSPIGDVKTMWTKISGPGPVTFDDAGAPITKAHIQIDGHYVLGLSAAHGADTATDTLSVFNDDSNDKFLRPTADTDVAYVKDNINSYTQNWGDAHHLWVSSAQTEGGEPGADISLIRFSLAGVKSIGKASFRLCGGMDHAAEPNSVFCLIDSVADTTWDEKTVNWTNKPSLGPQIAAFEVKPYLYNNQNKWNEIDLTSFVRAEKAAGHDTIDLAIVSVPTPQNITLRFGSRESGDTGPELVIEPGMTVQQPNHATR